MNACEIFRFKVCAHIHLCVCIWVSAQTTDSVLLSNHHLPLYYSQKHLA